MQGEPSSDADLQRQLELLKRQLLDAQKMAALGELVSTTTHEFNNVLMTILNYAKMGLRYSDRATRDKSFDKILIAAKRAERITNSVLGMARNRSHDFAPTDLKQLIEETLILLEREMHKYRVVVEKQFDEVPQVVASGNQIQQVLLNLLTNARQAMPKGGTITIKLRHDAKADAVDLCVRDTGQGIAQENLPRIFEPFFSTKQGPDSTGKGGTGVGLMMCREIIEAHQGKIRVDSTVGRGTAFTIKLPIQASSAKNRRERAIPEGTLVAPAKTAASAAAATSPQ